MTDEAEEVTVFVVDDHELMRRGLRDLLDQAHGFRVVGESGSAREAVRRIPALRPDVALLDVRLPDGSGIEVCREVRQRDPDIHVLMITTFDDDEARLASALAGAAGFILKQIHGEDLMAALRRVAAGEVLMNERGRAEAVSASRTSGRDPRCVGLTPQEGRILDLLGEGLSNRQIGERLGITERTAKNYVSKILQKMGFERRSQAAVFVASRHEPPTRRD